MLMWVLPRRARLTTLRASSLTLVFCVWAVGRLRSAGELTQLCFERVWNQLGCLGSPGDSDGLVHAPALK